MVLVDGCGGCGRWTMEGAGAAEPDDATAVVDVRGLRMRYGSVDVLDGVAFAARRGEALALLGGRGGRGAIAMRF